MGIKIPALDLDTIGWPSWDGRGNRWGSELWTSDVDTGESCGWNEEEEECEDIKLICDEWVVLKWDTKESDASGVIKGTWCWSNEGAEDSDTKEKDWQFLRNKKSTKKI